MNIHKQDELAFPPHIVIHSLLNIPSLFTISNRPQQTSPAGSIGSNHRPPYTQHQHHYPNHGQPQQPPHPQHLPQQQQQYNQNSQHSQQPQINRPPLPTASATDQNLNPQSTHLHPQLVANSRASSSSGGNASTVQSTGGGSISGTTGPSPSGVKPEQRLTHEQVNQKKNGN